VAAAERGRWYVQVAALASKDNANRLVTQLKAKGYAATIRPPSRGSLMRVSVGPFAERAEADRTARQLQGEGFKPLVTP
jgi:DedD protein